jgi:hypothetical protein
VPTDFDFNVLNEVCPELTYISRTNKSEGTEADV